MVVACLPTRSALGCSGLTCILKTHQRVGNVPAVSVADPDGEVGDLAEAVNPTASANTAQPKSRGGMGGSGGGYRGSSGGPPPNVMTPAIGPLG